MTAPTPYIRLEKVEVAYNEYVAGLRGVSLSIEKGEFVFLCGQTGSGKSTILKVLSCQVKPTAGKAFIEDFELGTATVDDVPLLRRKIGIVPQDFGLLPNKKVWENVGYAMRAVGRSRHDVRLEVPEILEKVNILHRADAYPSELSGGEQQRVAIARALINDPPLLLADEPTGNLDPGHSEEIIDLLAALNSRGTTVVVATHDMAVVARESRRIVKVASGRLASEDEDFEEDDEEDSSAGTESAEVIPTEPEVSIPIGEEHPEDA
ncbi:ATP-binding cassette domain-containing protein [Kamptonema cortianum]|nr:ATP-binding cassette domain-containing protein [Geitlerinema splendidum]MDK3162215.1 ATP-binding cassette domain-containing protein [Kamptonema cortianum]